MDQMMEIRMQKKQEYLSEEAILRQERKNKIEMFKIQNTDSDEVRDRNKRSPGVWSYEPDYYPWGMTNPSYSIGGKLDKGFLGNIPKKEDGTIGYESHAKIIANSLVNGYTPLPNYNSVCFSPPQYSFAKNDDRFILPNVSKGGERNLGPGSFFNNEFVTVNKNKEKVL